MSKEALFYYAQNLHILQRAHFTDSTGTVRGIGENGRDLLAWLCDATNQTRGYTFHHSSPYMAEHSGVHVATVKRLLPGFEQLGWITRTGEEIRYQGRGAPTVEYVLTFYPKAWAEYEKWRPSSQTSSHRATDNVGKANKDKALPEKTETETEPQPQPKPQPGEMGSGGEFDELLRQCIEWELANYRNGNAGAGLLRTWRNEYRPIVTRALRDRPTDDLVLWCVELRIPHRTGYQPKTHQTAPLAHLDTWTAPEWKQEELPGDPNCEHGCKGRTYHSVKVPTGKRLHHCKCLENGTYSLKDTQTTTDKVSADTACTAPADTQSELREQDYLATLNNKKELREVVRDMRSKYYLPADPF
jgi:hypothetical protein